MTKQSSPPVDIGSTEGLGPLPKPYAHVIAYTGRYATGGYCAEVQAESVKSVQERLYTADQMRKFAMQEKAAERERLRAALLDEAAEWTGDHRVPVHRALCDVAERAGVPLTFDECYLAAKRA